VGRATLEGRGGESPRPEVHNGGGRGVTRFRGVTRGRPPHTMDFMGCGDVPVYRVRTEEIGRGPPCVA